MKPHLKCIIRNNSRYYWCAARVNEYFLIIEVDKDYNIIDEIPLFRTHDELVEKKVRVVDTFEKEYSPLFRMITNYAFIKK
jgi:hypothetical protein